MQINLTWDLFIIVVFLIVVAYSFIIGKTNTVKLVLSSYISTLAADAIGNMTQTLLKNASPLMPILDFSESSTLFIVIKITLFVTFMVVLATKGSFDIHMGEEDPLLEFLITFFFGALSAGLIISGILVFSSGFSFIQGGVAISESNIAKMFQESYLVKVITLNYNLWFSLPVIAFLAMSLFKGGGEEE